LSARLTAPANARALMADGFAGVRLAPNTRKSSSWGGREPDVVIVVRWPGSMSWPELLGRSVMTQGPGRKLGASTGAFAELGGAWDRASTWER
jgi:hypothetical protein